MSKATAEKLHRLHGMLADSFTQRLELDIEDNTPTDAESLAYLASTDWYAIRQAETGLFVPPDVITNRKRAREAIVTID